MIQNLDSENTEYAAAVAAAAFSIHSIEEAESQCQRYRREDHEISKSRIKSRKEDSASVMPSSNRVTRRFSNKEPKNSGAIVTRNPAGTDPRARERVSSTRPIAPINVNQKQMERSPRFTDFMKKADSWEKAELEKIKRRYERVKSAILAWENERRMKVEIRMEKKKRELELRRERNRQYYQNQLEMIDKTARGARAQAEEKRRKEENRVKKKSKKIRSTGQVPITCFCF